MTKEEYEKALNSFCDNCKYGYDCKIMKKYNGCVQMNTLNQLIKEHFELVELLKPHDYGMLSTEEFEHWISYICKHNADNDMIIMSKNEQIKLIKNPQPYKFEDLKVGMWVWDDKEKKCNKIIEIEGRNIDFYYITESIDRFIVEFEEGRFYPVTKALCNGI